MTSVHINNISVFYKGEQELLKIPEIKIEGGNIVGFFGPNRVGKSTLLKLISKSSKDILWKGDGIQFDVKESELITVYQPQDYNSSLLPWYSIKKNITTLSKAYGFKDKEIERNLNVFLDEMGFENEQSFFMDYGFLKYDKENNLIPKKINELSGGQKQILTILRSVIVSPNLIALDEPFSAIDIFNKGLKFRNDIIDYLKRKKITTIIVSHDLEEILNLTDYLYIFNYDKQNKVFQGKEDIKLNKEEYQKFVDHLNKKYNLKLVL